MTKAKTKRTFSDIYISKRLFPYLLLQKKLLFITFLLIVGSTLLELASPYLISIVIDEYVLINRRDGILLIGVVYIVVLIVVNLTIFVRGWFLGIIGQSAIYQLRSDVHKHVQDLAMDYFDEIPLGDTISRLTSDLDQVEEILSRSILTAISAIFLVAGMILVLVSFSPLLTAITMLTIPLVILTAYLRKTIERPRWLKWREVWSKNTATMAEHISGARISLAFAREESNVEEYEKVNQEFYDATISALRSTTVLVPISASFVSIGTLLVVLFGGLIIITQQNSNLTPGILFLFISYQTLFFGPVTVLTNLYGQLQTSFTSLERIFKLQDRIPSVIDDEHAPEFDCQQGKITFKDVGFYYKEKTGYVLENFNLIIPPNQSIALVGETGSGKTTIVRLISRLYHLPIGQILIDDQDIAKVNLQSLRRQIGVVLQEPYLFSGTIRYNLTFGRGDVSEDEIFKTLSIIGADFVYSLSEGLDTNVGERGSRLSMGQRQLISFARALLIAPKILILDEATSSIDPESEMHIQLALKQMLMKYEHQKYVQP